MRQHPAAWSSPGSGVAALSSSPTLLPPPSPLRSPPAPPAQTRPAEPLPPLQGLHTGLSVLPVAAHAYALALDQTTACTYELGDMLSVSGLGQLCAVLAVMCAGNLCPSGDSISTSPDISNLIWIIERCLHISQRLVTYPFRSALSQVLEVPVRTINEACWGGTQTGLLIDKLAELYRLRTCLSTSTDFHSTVRPEHHAELEEPTLVLLALSLNCSIKTLVGKTDDSVFLYSDIVHPGAAWHAHLANPGETTGNYHYHVLTKRADGSIPRGLHPGQRNTIATLLTSPSGYNPHALPWTVPDIVRFSKPSNAQLLDATNFLIKLGAEHLAASVPTPAPAARPATPSSPSASSPSSPRATPPHATATRLYR